MGKEMTDVLYKYGSMATQEAKEHTLDILDNLRLYCASPESFNDPFECQAVISFDAPTDIKNELAKNHIMEEKPGISEMEARRLAPPKWQWVESNGEAEFCRWLREDTGVISFSACRDDILMWSHYAGSHDGICIEFKCTDEKHVDFLSQAHQVRYTQQRPIVNFYTTDRIEKAKAFILTKAERWSYEEEWRMIFPDAGERSRFLNLPTRIISAIYLGCKISPDNRTEVLRRVDSVSSLEQIIVFQAQRHPSAYCLMFETIRVPRYMQGKVCPTELVG
jgi:hypothetical protein